MSFTYEYPRPAVSTDCVVFAMHEDQLKILLIQRGNAPYKGIWALPGGFLEMDEDLESGAKRELQEETGLRNVYLEQLHTFGAVGRDPRGRVISVVFLGIARVDGQTVAAADDAADARWHLANRLPKLAFDHREIVSMARERLKLGIRYQTLGFELLPKKFTLRQLRAMFEIVLGKAIDKRNFRRKVSNLGLVVGLSEYQADVAHRAAELYRFDRTRYRALVKQGLDIDF